MTHEKKKISCSDVLIGLFGWLETSAVALKSLMNA
jgi:hypothetical protein